jgi:hypothetical protein
VNAARIAENVRRQVRSRAGYRCEYCLLAEEDAFFVHELDHIIAGKHGGDNTADNLALACFDCNRFKGSDIASRDPASGDLVPLFNPRTDCWEDHFLISDATIHPQTSVACATERLLRLNLAERVEIRSELAKTGRYPG